MKVADSSRRTDTAGIAYQALQEQDVKIREEMEQAVREEGRLQERNDLFTRSFNDSFSVFGQPEKSGGSGGFQMKSSTPEDSVGQLAALLAKAESKIDVQQVSSKAMRALASLKMSAMSCEEKDAKKIAQMIRRMKKLIKRIQKKLRQLNKEEALELRRKKAEQKLEVEKEKELREELRGKRTKRRRDEQNYALKEAAEDQRTAVGEAVSGVADAMAASMSADMGGAGGVDTAAGSVALDVTV